MTSENSYKNPFKDTSTETLISRAIEFEEQWQKLDQIDKKLRTEQQAQQKEDFNNKYWDIIHELRTRGSDVELEFCKKLVKSANFIERIIGADILGSLAWQDKQKYYDYAMKTLIELLDDKHAHVISSACFSLGHRANSEDIQALPKLIALANHENHYVREGVTFALTTKEHPQAIETLIKLCDDVDVDVRDWATFAIGSQIEQIETDTPEIRAVLKRKLHDEDFNVRGEALIGLAERQDNSILDNVKQELQGEFEGSYAIRASELLADPSLLPYLIELKKTKSDEMTSYHKTCLDDAIKACSNN